MLPINIINVMKQGHLIDVSDYIATLLVIDREAQITLIKP